AHRALRGLIPPRQLDRRVPRALEAVCLRALGPDPERRYRSAGEMERALRAYLRDAGYPKTATFDMYEVTMTDGKTKRVVAQGKSAKADEQYFCHGHTFAANMDAGDGKKIHDRGELCARISRREC